MEGGAAWDRAGGYCRMNSGSVYGGQGAAGYGNAAAVHGGLPPEVGARGMHH